MDAAVLRAWHRLSLSVVTDRLLTILGLTMTFALACWVMHEPTPERLGMAVGFAVFSWLMTNKRSNNKFKKFQTDSSYQHETGGNSHSSPDAA